MTCQRDFGGKGAPPSPRRCARWWSCGAVLCVLAAYGCSRPNPPAAHTTPPPSSNKHRVIIFIWDGLRPDSIDPQITPQLARIRDEQGVNFRNHHSVYPTFTMMNAAAFATGARSSRHGFYGNFVYLPGASGSDAFGSAVSFARPVFVEDYAVLHAIDEFLRSSAGTGVLRVETLFQAAHAHGLRTATLGKSGPAYLQDFRQDGSSGVILDENVALPRSFAVALQQAGLPLPINTVQYAYPEGPLKLSSSNGDPTATTEPSRVTLDDQVTPDPRAATGSPFNKKTAYLMRVYLEYVLPQLDPDLSLIWLRNPDSTEHTYGPGSPNALDALRHQDGLLGELLQTLERLGRTASTDLVIASDHGHSTVASDPLVFPPRALLGAADGHGSVGPIATPGYSVSGEARTTDLLRRAGFAHVYDGAGCGSSPVLAGVDAQAVALAATPLDCPEGTFDVPQDPLPDDAIVIAANGGSEYFYVPSHDRDLTRRLARALQERRQYGPVFVHSVYGALPGTLPLELIGMEPDATPAPPSPDLVTSFEWNAEEITAIGPNVPGTELSSAAGGRGMHGAFGPIDVHATLLAKGPSFRSGFADDYPSSNLDVAPTVAALLGFELSHAEGRALDEARASVDTQYSVMAFDNDTPSIQLDKLCALDDLACAQPGPAFNYRVRMSGQRLSVGEGGRSFDYYDQAHVERTPLP